MHYTMFSGFNAYAAQNGFENACRYAASLGFSGVEVQHSRCPDIFFSVNDAKAAASLLRRYALDASCYSVSACLYRDPDAETLVCRHIEYAAALGAPYVHHTLIPWLILPENAPSFADAISVITDAAERIANFARPLGITVIYEDQGLYVNGVQGFGAFYREIHRRCPNTGVCGDMGNSLFVDEGAEHFFHAYRDHLRHVHVKDYRRLSVCPERSDGWRITRGGNYLYETVVGQGVVHVDACMQVLRQIGYTGSVGLELGHPGSYEEGVHAAMTLCDRLWEEQHR